MLNQTRGLFASLAMLALLTGPVFAQPNVTVGSAIGVDPGVTLQIPVDITTATSAAGVNWKITYDSSKVVGDIATADGTGLGNHSLTANDQAGETYGVVYRTDVTEAFAADGTLALLSVTVPSTAPNGLTIDLTPDTNYTDDGIASAISDVSGAVASGSSFTAGQITVSTPYPLNVDDFAAWVPFDDYTFEPWAYNSGSSVRNGQKITIQNTNASNPSNDGERMLATWESANDLVPFYNEDVLVMMQYTVQSNKPAPVRGADMRFRATLLIPDLNTWDTLPEYQIYIAATRPGAAGPVETLPSSTPRDYKFFWSTDGANPTKNYKRMGWDMIAFGDGVPTDLTFEMTNFQAKRYDLTAVEAAAATVTDKLDFQQFVISPDFFSVGPLFPAGKPVGPGGPLPDIQGVFSTFNTPGKDIIATGDLDNQALAFIWPGGTGGQMQTDGTRTAGNNQVFSHINSDVNYTDLTVKEDSLYIIDFWSDAVGDGMVDRMNQPGHRYRINAWMTGESWTVTTQTKGVSASTAATGDAEFVKNTVYMMTNGDIPDGADDKVTISFDALNFLEGDFDSTNAGHYRVRRIRVREVTDFFTQATSGGWEID